MKLNSVDTKKRLQVGDVIYAYTGYTVIGDLNTFLHIVKTDRLINLSKWVLVIGTLVF